MVIARTDLSSNNPECESYDNSQQKRRVTYVRVVNAHIHGRMCRIHYRLILRDVSLPLKTYCINLSRRCVYNTVLPQ
jgi:hypothetical protein